MTHKSNKSKSPRDDQQPEALAEFAQSSREKKSEIVAKKLNADRHTTPISTDNTDKHDVATELLNGGANGGKPDPDAAGVDKLPDRIRESRD